MAHLIIRVGPQRAMYHQMINPNFNNYTLWNIPHGLQEVEYYL
jgi:hypothetical protein